MDNLALTVKGHSTSPWSLVDYPLLGPYPDDPSADDIIISSQWGIDFTAGRAIQPELSGAYRVDLSLNGTMFDNSAKALSSLSLVGAGGTFAYWAGLRAKFVYDLGAQGWWGLFRATSIVKVDAEVAFWPMLRTPPSPAAFILDNASLMIRKLQG